MEDPQIIGAEEEDEYTLYLGFGYSASSFALTGYQVRGMVTNVNMFSTALAIDNMVEITNGQGSENCRLEGDFISWAKSSWTHSRMNIENYGYLVKYVAVM